MSTIPRIIHQVWLGHKFIPPQLQAWSETIRAHHPDWEYRLWRDKDCQHLQHLMNKCWTLAGASNVVRIYALYSCGGVYLDFDMECYKPLDPLLDVAAFGAYDNFPYYHGEVYKHDAGKPIVCNAVMASVPNHRWMSDQILSLPHWVQKEPPWGPKLATVFLNEEVHLYPTEYFYPFVPGQPYKPHPDSFLAHHWQGMW